LQGLILPLVTPLVAVQWAKGFMGLADVPLDIFNMTTPILILAVGAGHAVQLLKRYYEEYNVSTRNRARQGGGPGGHRQAVVDSIVKIGPVMLLAGAGRHLRLSVADDLRHHLDPGIRLFSGVGILCVLIVEMTLIPALRSLLPAPGKKEARLERENDSGTGSPASTPTPCSGPIATAFSW